jgi:hypothetical protein
MASSLIHCNTCNLQVAAYAKTCADCGAKLRKGTLRKVGFWLLATPFALLTLPAFVEGFSVGSALLSPEQTKERHEYEDRFKLAWTRVSAVKSGIRDPKTFALESVHVTRADVVCIEYSARNGFGGMNRESIVVDGTQPYPSTDNDSRFFRMWNELCAGQESWNFTDRVKSSL